MLVYKMHYLDRLFDKYKDKDVEVLDLGSGTSKDWVDILKKYENIKYTGVEFDKNALNIAKTILSFSDKVSFINNFGEKLETSLKEQFDIVISLSVLEHVKNLDDFLLTSVNLLKPGGLLIHRYDLGHALHSESITEKIKVFLCKRLPFIISSSSFTTHPDKKGIVKFLNQKGIQNIKIEQHQIPNLKKLTNILKKNPENVLLMKKIIELDSELFNTLSSESYEENKLDKYFPAITISGIKEYT